MITFSWGLTSASPSSPVYTGTPAVPLPSGPGDVGLFVSGPTVDALVSAGDLAPDSGLQTAILLSLYLHRRAEPGDVLPEGATDRRGWWADAFPLESGDKIGSRLWLLERSKRTPETLERAREYTAEALAWLIEDRVAERVEVETEFIGAPPALAITVRIYAPGAADPAQFRFSPTWATEGAR